MYIVLTFLHTYCNFYKSSISQCYIFILEKLFTVNYTVIRVPDVWILTLSPSPRPLVIWFAHHFKLYFNIDQRYENPLREGAFWDQMFFLTSTSSD
jgi:hypothetical protein